MSPPKHWAKPGAKLTRDEAPFVTAPKAGGAKLDPPEPADWEWQQCTVIKPSGLAAPPQPSADDVKHSGSCHCGDIQFEVMAPSNITIWECNCSNCRMRRNVHLVVPKSALTVKDEKMWDRLAEYRYGTGTARHLFCARCDITPFYVPRSNPDGWGISFQCISGGTVSSVEVKQFDGLRWEECIQGAGAAIKEHSKGGDDNEKKASDAPTPAAAPNAAAKEAAPSPRVRAAPPTPTPYAMLFLEVVFSFLLPLAMILAAMWATGKKGLPGRPGDDLKLHALAK
jgi:hypothetical protein